MIFLKLYFHAKCMLEILFYKLNYGYKFKLCGYVNFRKGFSLIIEDNGVVEIGKNCFFNNYCTIASKDKIIIGNNSIFGENVKIYDHNHKYQNKDLFINNQGYNVAPIKIGNNCWIGSNVVILKGVTIGNNCVIGAGCVIHKDVASNSVVLNRQDLIINQN